ncbi:expressed unknown protein [Seminavis robusta]|uniref:Uncharacterized protein n=1 Tax=Seminavis robusta TaxID=568900 RepID=A0A9N8EU77_9STRA|nr:expressed unknown protein [Seminavis robusta]|eukprot:Sro1585_g284160.1 n/a (264) ;mRNA; r:25554-26345
MGTRFLQALLFAAVVALGSYWVVLIRRYMKTQNKRRNLEERVAGRSARRSSTEGNDGSSRSTDSGRGENTDHHMMNTSHCEINIREQEDDLNYSSESEDDEEEIMFQKPEDIEALRQQCFTQSFDPTLLFGPEEEMKAMSAADHAVPAMNVLLQQETYLRQLREARKAKRAAASAAGFQYSPQNRQLLEALGTTATKLQSSSFDSSTQRQTIDNGYFPTQQHAAAMMNSRQVGTGSGTAGDALDALMQTSMNQAATSEKHCKL